MVLQKALQGPRGFTVGSMSFQGRSMGLQVSEAFQGTSEVFRVCSKGFQERPRGFQEASGAFQGISRSLSRLRGVPGLLVEDSRGFKGVSGDTSFEAPNPETAPKSPGNCLENSLNLPLIPQKHTRDLPESPRYVL